MSDERLEQGFGSDDLPGGAGPAWYVSGTMVVTGERKNRPVEPRHPGSARSRWRVGSSGFALRGVPGDDDAVQEPARRHHLPGGGHRSRRVGLNWYVNRWVKVQVNSIREQIDDVERSPVPDGAAFWSQVVRFQLALCSSETGCRMHAFQCRSLKASAAAHRGRLVDRCWAAGVAAHDRSDARRIRPTRFSTTRSSTRSGWRSTSRTGTRSRRTIWPTTTTRAIFKWGSSRRAQRRHPLARHRQPQRRQARPARRFRPLYQRPEVSRPEVVRPAQQHAGPHPTCTSA